MTTIGQLDPFFTSLLSSVMTVERQPLTRLTQARDTVNVRRGVYQDLSSKLEALQDLAQSLTTTDPLSVLAAGRKLTVSNVASGSTVATASAGSSAGVGTYDLSVSLLARSQRRASAVQANTDQALGLTGTFWLGGTGTASASVSANATVTGASATAVSAGLRELGTGTYTVETRTSDGVLQFRLKDVDGQTVAIADAASADGALTTAWQDVSAGAYDTTRGLTITFSGTGSDASTSVDYTAAGVGVSVAATDSLQTIAANINSAVQPEGRDAVAAVVGKQLILTAAHTGTAHTMIYTDSTGGPGLGFTGVDLQAARDASFSVNGIDFTRSHNTGLTDVVAGVTLNLAADAEAKTATLTVESDLSAARSGIDSFVESFNTVVAYLQEKTSVTATTTNGATTYTRAALAGETIFDDLRSRLLSTFMSDASNAGSLKSLREIGLTIDDNLRATVSDSAKLDSALSSDLSGVKALLDEVMGGFDALLDRFTGAETGYMGSALESFEGQLADADAALKDLNLRLAEREQSLVNQFAELQAQLISMTYAQQQWASIAGVGRLY